MTDNTITIRVAKPEDAKELLAIYAHYVKNTAITFEYEVPSVEEFTARIKNTLKKYPYFVAEVGSEIAGYTYAGDFHTRANLINGERNPVFISRKICAVWESEQRYIPNWKTL